MHGLENYLKAGLFCKRKSLLHINCNTKHRIYLQTTHRILIYLFDCLYIIQCLISFSSCDHILHFCKLLLMLFHLISMRFSQSTHLLRYTCRLNVHHKDCLIYSGETNRPSGLCYNVSFSNDLTQMVNFPTWFFDCDSHSPTILDLFFSYDVIICYPVDFPPQRIFDLVVVSVFIDSPSNSKRDTTFHHKVYNYSRANQDGVPNNMRVVPCEDVLKLGASFIGTEFCMLVQVAIDLYILHHKHQDKINLSHCFQLFVLLSKKSSGSKVKLRQASNPCKRALEAAKLAYAINREKAITYHKLRSYDFSESLIVFSLNINL